MKLTIIQIYSLTNITITVNLMLLVSNWIVAFMDVGKWIPINFKDFFFFFKRLKLGLIF